MDYKEIPKDNIMLATDASQFWLRYDELSSKHFSVIKKTGIRPSTLSTWKKKNIFPRADEACLIAQAINTSVEYLVTGQNKSAATHSVIAHELSTVINQLSEEKLQILKSVAATLLEQK